jgi:hypothetical protein
MSFFTDASFVMDPSVYRAGTLFVPKPTDGSGDLTFTRSSGATRVGPNGYIEKVRTNLILQSQTFDNATWSKSATGTGVAPVVTANNTTAPDGTLTADKIIADATLGQHRVNQTPTTSAGTQTFSVYAKAGGYSYIFLRIGLTGAGIIFNVANGTFAGAQEGITASIASVGNGWYRCSVTVTSALANDVARINVSSLSTGVDFSGNGFDGVYIWGAQLE